MAYIKQYNIKIMMKNETNKKHKKIASFIKGRILSNCQNRKPFDKKKCKKIECLSRTYSIIFLTIFLLISFSI